MVLNAVIDEFGVCSVDKEKHSRKDARVGRARVRNC